MFSAQAAMACTSTFGFSAATAAMRATTFAAPLMSCFISPMPDAGLMLIPPLSNVIPFPTKAGFLRAPLGVHEIWTNRGSRRLPTDGVDELHAATPNLREIEHSDF